MKSHIKAHAQHIVIIEASNFMKMLQTLLLVITLSPLAVSAKTIGDIDIPDTIKVSQGSPDLNLNGASMRRTFMVVKTYIGGLYLEKTSQNVDEILARDEYRRMLFHVLLRKVTAHKIARALKDALVLNIPRDEQELLGTHIDQFVSMFKGKLYKGDEVNIDYIPGQGTRVEIAGIDKGTIPGKRFSDAMLSIWIGENPVGNSFKKDILGILPAVVPEDY